MRPPTQGIAIYKHCERYAPILVNPHVGALCFTLDVLVLQRAIQVRVQGTAHKKAPEPSGELRPEPASATLPEPTDEARRDRGQLMVSQAPVTGEQEKIRKSGI